MRARAGGEGALKLRAFADWIVDHAVGEQLELEARDGAAVDPVDLGFRDVVVYEQNVKSLDCAMLQTPTTFAINPWHWQGRRSA